MQFWECTYSEEMNHWEKMTHEYSKCTLNVLNTLTQFQPPLRRHLETLNRVLHPVPNSQDGQISQIPHSSDPLHILYFTLSFLCSHLAA